MNFSVYKQDGWEFQLMGEIDTRGHVDAITQFVPRAVLLRKRRNISHFVDGVDIYKVQYHN